MTNETMDSGTTKATSTGPPGESGSGGRTGPFARWSRETVLADIAASLVVFLVAVPLCVGIAVASGAPPELGIVTGIVGGIVVGVMPGSTMQVSGPAAGLTVLVAGAIQEHGLATLGVIVLGAGVLQILLGLVRAGTWFRAISPSVVQGMLAGIGLVIILGQVYPIGGLAQPSHTAEKITGLPNLGGSVFTTSTGLWGLIIAAVTIVIASYWKALPGWIRHVPGPLVAVVVTSAATMMFNLPLQTIEVGSLLAALNVPAPDAFGGLLSLSVLGSIVTFALIASAESLFSAAAVDRMHDQPKTQFNKELIAQGAGNTICGVFGALPMTAVIVRSATNVQAGARTRLSRVLHGGWLLVFVVLLPGVLNFVPTAVLAALLVQAGWKLLEPTKVLALAREQRSEAFILIFTALMIVGTDLLIGTLAGLLAAVIKTAIDVSGLSVQVEHDEDRVRVVFHGNATFLRLPRILERLEGLPAHRSVHLDLSTVRHLDRACHQAVENWAAQRRKYGTVEVAMPANT